MHDEVSLDGSLGDEGATHAGERLPAGEHSRTVCLLWGHSRRLLHQLAKYLGEGGGGGRKEGRGDREGGRDIEEGGRKDREGGRKGGI